MDRGKADGRRHNGSKDGRMTGWQDSRMSKVGARIEEKLGKGIKR